MPKRERTDSRAPARPGVPHDRHRDASPAASDSPYADPADGSLTTLPPVPTAEITVLPEPELEFRYGQRVVDPHAGLALFGPPDADAPGGHPRQVIYGVIGTPEGIAAFAAFAESLTGPIVSQAYGDPNTQTKSQLLWPPFPGFDAAFTCAWPAAPTWSRVLDRAAMLTAAQHNDPYRRAYDVAGMYNRAIRAASERDDAFSLLICVVPDLVYRNCRPESVVKGGEGVRVSRLDRIERRRQADLFSAYDPEEYELSVDFRRQLKARSMEFGIPIQIIRESTLRLTEAADEDGRTLTPLSDRAWNLATTFYYKAGGKPWRLATAREGVCYIGLAFRQSELDGDERTACCAAQMFLDTGDGVVFRGEFGPWYSAEKHEFHLAPEAAEQLLRGVLEEYASLGGKPLKEIFLHSRSMINRSEFAGYLRACPPGVKLVGVRVRHDTDGIRLYRPGKWPVLRGSMWALNDRTAYLWATGFKPSLLSYDGAEVPVPLRLDVQHGDADIRQVATDILGLTKLNYNTCKIGDGDPVTVGFSDQVGEILIGNPKIKVRRASFKFYI